MNNIRGKTTRHLRNWHISTYFCKYSLKWKITKNNVQRSGWNCEENFFPINISVPMQSIKWRCKQINKKKNFFCATFCLRECLCVPQGSFVLFFSFYGSLLVIPWFYFLYVPIFARFPEVMPPRCRPEIRRPAKSYIFLRIHEPKVCHNYFGNMHYNINRTWLVSSKLDST